MNDNVVGEGLIILKDGVIVFGRGMIRLGKQVARVGKFLGNEHRGHWSAVIFTSLLSWVLGYLVGKYVT